MRSLPWVMLAVGLTSNARAAEPQAAYRNPKLPIEQRVADLVKRMTQEEKLEQLMGGRRRWAAKAVGEEGVRLFAKIEPLWHKEDETSPHDAAALRNEMQKYLAEKTRLGIPALFLGEALHGYMAHGATSFPQVLGLASTWDPELIQQVFTAA